MSAYYFYDKILYKDVGAEISESEFFFLEYIFAC